MLFYRLVSTAVLVSLVSSLIMVPINRARADGNQPTVAAHATELPKKSPKSVAAKLYWIAKLMDTHENWLRVSELLRETLELELKNDYVISRLRAVKQYVDRERTRQAAGTVARSRLDSHSFLEARLLIVECIQELRPRLNLSWTGEVRHFKRMLFTALFPHAEAYGKIEFPNPSTYAFDIYGYTLKNAKALMITPGGRDFSPLFKEFLVDDQKKKQGGSSDWDDDSFGSNMNFGRLSNFQDHIYSTLRSEGIDGDLGADGQILPNSWDPKSGSGTSDWDTSSGWGDDDWDWRKKSESEERIQALTRAYRFVKAMVSALRNHRSIDEYEPLTLMMTAVSNPALIEEDPQLKDFVAGIKFKLQIPISGMDSDSFKPKEYHLVELVNDALSPNAPAKLEFAVDSRTGQTLLYLTSNFNGSTNIAVNMFSFHNVAMVIQGARYMPESAVAFLKATPENASKLTETINSILTSMSKNENQLYKVVGWPAQLAFNLVLNVGGKPVAKLAEATTKVVQRIAANPRVAKGIDIVKSEGFLRVMVGLAVATDVTTGLVELYYNNDKYETPRIVMRTAARAGSALVYLAKYKPAIWTAVVLDIGHLVFSKIPSTENVFEYSFNYSYDRIYEAVNGYSPRDAEMNEVKKQLGMTAVDEAATMLSDYEAGIKAATTVEALDGVRTRLADRLGTYAARRLVFHYVAISSLNGGGDRDVGLELRRQFEEYDRLYWTWFTSPGTSGKREQLGLKMLDRDFDEKYVKLGGKLPEKPKVEPPKPRPTGDDPVPAGPSGASGAKKKKKAGDVPWED